MLFTFFSATCQIPNKSKIQEFRFIRKKVERVIRLTGFPLKLAPAGLKQGTCGNDEQKPPLKIVILGLDPGIQGLFNLNTKDTLFLILKG